MQKWILLLIFLVPLYIFPDTVLTGRLLVNIDPQADFSPEKFSKASSAHLVQVERRNPYKAFSEIFLNTPFVVISPPLEELALIKLAKRFGYRTVNFSGGSLETAVEKANELLETIPRYSSQIPYATPSEALRIYELMKKVDRLFTDFRIKYWATAGTLLGTIRHHGLIPWDDDIDVCIMEADEPKLNDIQEGLDLMGLELYFHPDGYYKIFEKEGTLIEDSESPRQYLPFKYPYADVFVVTLEMRKEFQDVYVHKSQYSYWNYPDERYKYSQIETLSSASFGPLLIPIPGEPELYLNANYGTYQYPELWKKYAIEPPWSHKFENEGSSSGTALVEIDDFSPAPFIP